MRVALLIGDIPEVSVLSIWAADTIPVEVFEKQIVPIFKSRLY